jgi:hypothetical protein
MRPSDRFQSVTAVRNSLFAAPTPVVRAPRQPQPVAAAARPGAAEPVPRAGVPTGRTSPPARRRRWGRWVLLLVLLLVLLAAVLVAQPALLPYLGLGASAFSGTLGVL